MADFNVRKEDGAALMGIEYINKNLYRELYADGSIYTKNKNDGKIEKIEKVSIDVLKKAVSNYKDNGKIIIIGDLLKAE